MSARLCDGPGNVPGQKCERKSESLGLCHAHYRQHYRGKPLAPLRDKDRKVLKLPGITVSYACAKALSASASNSGQTPYQAARLVLERWARTLTSNEPMTAANEPRLTSVAMTAMTKEGVPP